MRTPPARTATTAYPTAAATTARTRVTVAPTGGTSTRPLSPPRARVTRWTVERRRPEGARRTVTGRVSNRPPSEATLRRLERASGSLATQAVARMDEQLTWFRTMPADQRSWVMLVAQAGIASLVEWCRSPGNPPQLTGEVFGAAPRDLV